MSTFGITDESAYVTALIVIIVICMSNLIKLGLRYKNFTTIRAVLTFSKTDFGTSGCLWLVNYFGMTLCRRKLSLTYGTNLCVKTICLITCSMSKCGNNLLCNLIVASVAMLSLCQTVFCTGGSLSTISNNTMIECRNLLLLYKDFATILTWLSIGETWRSARSSLAFDYLFLMTCGWNCYAFLFTARAGTCLRSLFIACSCLGNNPFTILMNVKILASR